MIFALLINVVLLTAIIGSVHAVGIYDQCAGEGYATLPCNPGLSCFRRSKWFSSCLYTCPRGQGWECEFYLPPIQTVAQAWEQCGGQGWGGALFCPTGYTCYSRTIYYAQCRPVNDCPPGWVCPPVVATPTPPLPSILPAYAKCNNVANAICPVSTACFRYSNTYSECRPTCPVTWACETDVVGPNEQCGGDGYVGLTRCAAGLRCYARSKWYSHCAASCPGVEWAC